MREFNRQELARCDGREGRPSLFAYEGRVYDATQSFLWRGGIHQVTHLAGTDLTEAMQEAPHGADVIERCPVVGVLVD